MKNLTKIVVIGRVFKVLKSDVDENFSRLA